MADQQLWQRQLCGYVLDPAGGDVKPTVVFEDIPADWLCPVRGAEKDDFMLQDDVKM
jgi:rubredoxin